MKMFTVILECHGEEFSREETAHADSALEVYGMDWDGWQVVDVQEFDQASFKAWRDAEEKAMYGRD